MRLKKNMVRLTPKKVIPATVDVSWRLAQPDARARIAGFTCAGRRDRMGSRVHAHMSARLFHKMTGIPYFHTPLDGEVGPWETVFNLGDGFPPPPPDLQQVYGYDISRGYQGAPALVRQVHFHQFADRNPDLYHQVIDDFRRSLVLPPPPGGGPVIAVHVRRGDVAYNEKRKRYTWNRTVARHIRIARKQFPDARVEVYSQGRVEDFRGLPKDCTYFLDTDLFETMSALIHADCLVMAKSSMTYVAALLSKGTVYYQGFWHKPMSHWHRLPRLPI